MYHQNNFRYCDSVILWWEKKLSVRPIATVYSCSVHSHAEWIMSAHGPCLNMHCRLQLKCIILEVPLMVGNPFSFLLLSVLTSFTGLEAGMDRTGVQSWGERQNKWSIRSNQRRPCVLTPSNLKSPLPPDHFNQSCRRALNRLADRPRSSLRLRQRWFI